MSSNSFQVQTRWKAWKTSLFRHGRGPNWRTRAESWAWEVGAAGILMVFTYFYFLVFLRFSMIFDFCRFVSFCLRQFDAENHHFDQKNYRFDGFSNGSDEFPRRAFRVPETHQVR